VTEPIIAFVAGLAFGAIIVHGGARPVREPRGVAQAAGTETPPLI
jgi:hypothetical protein